MSTALRKARPRAMMGTEFTAEQIAAAVKAKSLLSMELEMTRACNLLCTYCYAAAGQAWDDEMQFAEILQAVRQAANLGARKIVILGGGEPCVYAHLRELIDHIVKSGLSAEMFTNCTLIDDELAGFLYERKVSVAVKRNALDAQTQDRLAGVPGTFERIEKGIASLLRAGYPDAQRGLGVQTVICRANLRQIPRLWRWTRQIGAQPYFECLTRHGRAADNPDLALSASEVHKAFQTLSRIDSREYGLQWRPRPPRAGSGCNRHLYSILLKANGDICPCVGFDVPLGNIRRDRLADVLASHPIIDDMRNIYDRIKGGCKSCALNKECYGCRGNAFRLTGDHLAADPCCWKNCQG